MLAGNASINDIIRNLIKKFGLDNQLLVVIVFVLSLGQSTLDNTKCIMRQLKMYNFIYRFFE